MSSSYEKQECMIGKTFFRWHCMPILVLLIGFVSIFLLVWVDRLNDRQRADFLRADALEHAQIHASVFHLWLEETLAGDAKTDRKDLWFDLEQAIRLVDEFLNGRQTADGSVLEQLTDPELRSRAETLRALLLRFKTTALARTQDRALSGIGSEADQRFDKLFREILTTAGEMERKFEAARTLSQAKTRRLITGILLTWVLIVFVATAEVFTREKRRLAAEKKLLETNEQLQAQAGELKAHREHLAEMVERRTGELRSANTRLTREIGERSRTEEALRASQKELRRLSTRLLSAQEEERRKISRELHDELGQSLTLVKYQLRSVEKQLREDQGVLREECGNILRYLNTVIENVRRLSRDLCPFILEDLGLTQALRWLAGNVERNHEIKVVLELPELDGLFSRNAQTGIYRILQEALTNIVKHSGAGNAMVAVRASEGELAVTIEDDGQGFDLKELASRDAAGKGMGLTSMAERAGMLGGALELWSEPGKGTRISFRVPVAREEETHEPLSYCAGR
jgi:signal transduction histidine kinase